MRFKGSITALVCPFKLDQSLDLHAFAKLVAWQMEFSSALVINGTTGENSCLTEKEQLQLFKQARAIVGPKYPLIAGTGSSSTAFTIAKTQQYLDLADACLVVTPYYNRPNPGGLFLHYAELAAACPIDIILYNVPKRTGVDLTNETVLALSSIKNIIGLKDASGDLKRLADLKANCPADFALLSGDDASALEFVQQGGVGAISVAANILPASMQKILLEQDESLNSKLTGLYKFLCYSNPVAIKWLLAQSARIKDVLRLPLTSLDTQYYSEGQAVLAAIKDLT